MASPSPVAPNQNWFQRAFTFVTGFFNRLFSMGMSFLFRSNRTSTATSTPVTATQTTVTPPEAKENNTTPTPPTYRSSHGTIFQIFVKSLDGRTITMDVSSSDKIEDLENNILVKTGEAANPKIQLIFAGKRLENGRTLADYQVAKESTIHQSLRLN
jgi:ubiquitin-large subunit ribosomal protein L40e